MSEETKCMAINSPEAKCTATAVGTNSFGHWYCAAHLSIAMALEVKLDAFRAAHPSPYWIRRTPMARVGDN